MGVGPDGCGYFRSKGITAGVSFFGKKEESLGENEVWPSSWEGNKEQIEKK